jgi:sugar phosphate isomerase/epimerase
MRIVTRRRLFAGLAAGATAAAQFRPGNGPKSRTTPAVCLYSQVLIKIPYDELGGVLRGMGVDGCDLTVMPGGHVQPEQSAVDLMRAVEAVTGVGLDVPVITTAFTSLADPSLRNVAAIAGEMGIPLLRAGQWKYPPAGEIEARLTEVQRDISGLAALARAVKMALALRNTSGDNVGGAIWDTHMLIRGLDPQTVGYDFDIGNAAAEGAAGGWYTALRLALPRIKMVTARDFVWNKEADGKWKRTPCVLGEGMVDWPRLVKALASVRFNGPISLPVDYAPTDEISAIRHDVEFIRKHVAAAYA